MIRKLSLKVPLMVILLMGICGCGQKLQGIEGEWILNNNSLMSINEKSFTWYKNVSNKNANYLKGTDVKILSKEAALNAIHVPSENKNSLLKTHTFYLSVTYKTIIINNEDVSQNADGKLSEFAFKITGKDQMSIVNLNNNEQYTAHREVKE